MDNERFKNLEEILQQDPRSEVIGRVMPQIYGTLETWYTYVDSVQLNDAAPDQVKRNFNRAKNLSLYAWHVYDFHQVAEMDAISTFEMAMKIKFEQSDSPVPKGLKNRYSRAVELGWIKEHQGNDGKTLADYRNDLAHGTTMLHEQSVRTLAVCAMYINQLYRDSAEGSDENQ